MAVLFSGTSSRSLALGMIHTEGLDALVKQGKVILNNEEVTLTA